MNNQNTSLTVAKFGGTSVANFEAINRCVDIIEADPKVRLVVVSAAAGVTNRLVELSAGQTDLARRQALLHDIAAIEYAMLDRLENRSQVAAELDALLALMASLSGRIAAGDGEPALADQLLSLGERCSTLLLTELLNQRGIAAVNFDACQVMRTDDHFGRASPQLAQLESLCEQHLLPQLATQVVVTQGFIGADQQGRVTTLGRGGSDYSAALLAQSLRARVLAIWTDVDGIYSCDPRVVADAHPIAELSFNEAAEMATFGSKILHPATILPAVRGGCQVFVGSTYAPQKGGTWIRSECGSQPVFRALSLRRRQTLLTAHSLNMLHAQGFLAELFAVLARHRISVDLITTSEVSVALTLDQTGSDSSGRALVSQALLDELAPLCRVEVEQDLALVAVIGNHIAKTSGIGIRVLEAMQDSNVRMFCQGASAHNLCFLVDGDEAESIVQRLHRQLLTA
ncbi:lysine-sensitive aspartokinase 3 [Ferrimonas kyonanensis]|uniref:lysine-sensitive aspartokinase 3 n=1 Tax=Ferrimonas kyonanensis TaxID=364763 RepID=UPI000406AF15|nr:lysine-sensitive aspartokinase 3 [Ferrimonas kyonanensis]